MPTPPQFGKGGALGFGELVAAALGVAVPDTELQLVLLVLDDDPLKVRPHHDVRAFPCDALRQGRHAPLEGRRQLARTGQARSSGPGLERAA